jgi:hypothetical protein
MTSAPAPAIETTDAVATPDRAIPCTRCGYDLRGAAANGRCPECGLPAYWSLRAPEQLSQYPAKWVASMAWATRLLALAYGGMFLLLVAAFAALLDGVPWVALIGSFAGALLQLVGAWMLARRSGHWSEPRAAANRLLLRASPVAPAIAGGIGVYMEATRTVQPQWLAGALLASMCGWMVAPPAVFFRMRTLARMIADARLARQSTIAFRGLLASLLAMGICIGVIVILSYSPFETPIGALFSVMVMAVMLCFLLWGAVVMIFCVRDFGRAARVARRAETIAEAS